MAKENKSPSSLDSTGSFYMCAQKFKAILTMLATDVVRFTSRRLHVVRPSAFYALSAKSKVRQCNN